MENTNINPNAYKVIQYLKNNYTFEYTFDKEELEKYGFLNPKMQWLSKPIIFASGETDNTLEVMAYGGCIGRISLDDDGSRCFSDEEIKDIMEYAKYLSPKEKTDEYYQNQHKHYIYLPEKFVNKYAKEGKARMLRLLDGTNTVNQLLLNKEYLDLMVCAAYVRFMHREAQYMVDVSERSMQSMIARSNLDNCNESNMIVIDVEFKEKIDGKTPSVDFVVMDKKGKSFGLIEFKYQGESMNPNDKNSLTEHFRDFRAMITERKTEIVNRLIGYTMNAIAYGIIDDLEAKKTVDLIKERYEKGQLQNILWCGFYFVDDKSKKTKRKIEGKVKGMLMEERIECDCRMQILDVFEDDLLKSELEVRYQHSDINDSKQIVLDDNILVLREV